jgi:geranylgeranyl pyrophosphate synthase
LGPGKRLRPALVLAAFEELGGRGDAVDLAAAVEIVHAYSLVHDDLPCMDDDDLRRGRPTTHRQFGVPVALEAGFRMVTLAARALAHGGAGLGLSTETLGTIGSTLFRAAGAAGMVGGQVLDLEAEAREVELDELRDIHRRKTGALITASAEIGAIAAGVSGEALEAVCSYGEEIGVAFQIADDVLDATASSATLGKTAGKDAAQRKATFAALLGPDSAMIEARLRVALAIDQLGAGGINSLLLNDLAYFIINRRS